MWLRKIQGGTSIGPYEWPEDGSVAEVPDRFGQELLAIPESGFEKVSGPEPENAITEPGPTATVTEGGGSHEPGTDPAGDGSDGGSDGDGGGPDAPPADGEVKPEDAKTPRKSRAKEPAAPAA